MKQKRFEKVVEGWDLIDTMILIACHIGLILSIYLSINSSGWNSLGTAFLTFVCFVGWSVFGERKVYYCEVKE